MSSLSSKKRTKTSRQVVKLNLFFRFLEEILAWENNFQFNRVRRGLPVVKKCNIEDLVNCSFSEFGHFLENKADFPWSWNIARTRGRRKRRRRRRHCACWWNGISLYSSPFSSHFTTFPGTYIFLKLLIPEKPAIILLIHNQLVLLSSRKSSPSKQIFVLVFGKL